MKKKKLWTVPFGFTESFLLVSGLLTVGTVLQAAVGSFDFYLLHSPVNYWVFGAVCLVCLVLSRLNNAVVRWLTGLPLGICLTAAVLFLAVLMGLIPQRGGMGHIHGFIGRFGLDAVTSSWQFVLCCALLVLSLGTLSFKRLFVWNRKNLFFFINHAGLFLVLLGAGLGAADMRRFVMYVYEHQTQWQVFSETQESVDLPVAVTLHDFDMEYYPPKLVLIDRKSGEVFSGGQQFYQLEEQGNVQGRLGEFNIEILTYYHHAVWAGNGEYREYDMIGASPAAKVRATDLTSGESREGWVTAGNMSQFVSALYLGENLALVMTKPEPKRFVSDITVMTREGLKIRTDIEVNKPLRLGDWMIYQYGYDDRLGDLSPYSSFELVYDPWLGVVYAGLAMLCLGSVILVWLGRKEM